MASGQYIGQSWSRWPLLQEEFPFEVSSSSSSSSSLSTPSGMATPIHMHTEDTMKLPKQDMKHFGLCPIQDDLILVVCDICHKNVKIEAFHEHFQARHEASFSSSSSSSSTSGHVMTSKSKHHRRAAKAAAAAAAVELLKEETTLNYSTATAASVSNPATSSTPIIPSVTSSNTSSAPAVVSSCSTIQIEGSKTSSKMKSLRAESNVPAPSSEQVQQSIKEKDSEEVLTLTSAVNSSTKFLPSKIVDSASVASTTQSLSVPTPSPALATSSSVGVAGTGTATSAPFVSVAMTDADEADSTTANNVISIPDTAPLPHGMSNDLMAMVAGELGPDEPGDSTSASATTTPSIQLNSPVINLQLSDPANATTTLTPPAPSQQQRPQTPSQGSKKASPAKKGSSSGKDARKLQREYHPDRHCGVWDNDSKRHCTRALTCKSHSVLLKRKIPGRSKSFDELVAAHKANKEAMAIAAKMQANSSTSSSPVPVATASTIAVTAVETSARQYPSTGGIKRPSWSISASPRSQSSVIVSKANGAKRSLLSPQATAAAMVTTLPGKETDENLHYTTDHPKPLAVCNFGARQMGGLLLTDRSQFLTRKVVRVAISAGGFQRIRQNRLNELRLNSNNSNSILTSAQLPTILPPGSAIIKPQAPQQARIAQVTAVGVTTSQPGSEVLATTPSNKFVMNYNFQHTTGGTTASFIKRGGAANNSGSGPALLKTGGVVTSVTPAMVAGGTTFSLSGGNPTTTVNLATPITGSGPIPINIAAASEATFKTDIQDFKGGIQFELGRKMKPILPSSGNEVAQ